MASLMPTLTAEASEQNAASSKWPSRILVREVNWLGDLVISLPALLAIRRRFPAARLSILVRMELAGFFDGLSWIDEVIPFVRARGIAGFRSDWRTIKKIRARRFDVAVLFPNSFSSALWVALAGVPRRVGFATDWRSALLTGRMTPDSAALSGHQTEYWLNLVRDGLGADAKTAVCALDPDNQNRERMRQLIAKRRKRPDARLIAIAPAAAYGPAKEWPLKRFAALIDLLAERHHAECVLIGTPAERDRCGQIARASGTEPLALAGETSVGELIALLSLCDGFAGNDSGAAHLAGALGIPTVAIFGSTDPFRTGPLGPRVRIIYRALECSPCLARTCRFGHYNCLNQIRPDEAADALAALGAFGTSAS
ncbi:MAG: lipopolysaccharide heptosyltransferase II [Candidatus Binataceae bacterium]